MSKIPEEWSRHLTSERRANFDKDGEDLVSHRVKESLWLGDVRLAAQAWLSEKRHERDQKENIRFHLIFWTAFFTLLAALYPLLCHR